MVKLVKEWFIQQFAYQLIVPEFKARHVCWTYGALLDWECKYHHMNTKAVVIYPLHCEGDWAGAYTELTID